jgi:hypothetical protein
MKGRILASAALVSALPGLVACGGDHGPSSPSSTPTKAIASVPGNTQVSEMTPAQQQQASQDMQAYFAANIPPETAKQMACGMMGLMMAGLEPGSDPKAACQSIYDQCMQSASTADAGADTSAPSTPSPSALQNCTATVDQVNQCLAEEVAAFKTLAAAMNCNNAGADAATMATPAMPACDAIEAQCPGITGADTSDAGISA